MNKLFVISLGGSLIVPDEIDVKYLREFRKIILNRTAQGSRFIISTGGGKTCRKYQAALQAILPSSDFELDTLGLNTCRFHSKFLQLIFKKHAENRIAEDPNKKIPFKKKILIGAGGWKPGRSSDDFSVRLAKIYGAGTVINLSNIDYVYTKDPRKFKDAKIIKNISWQNFRKLVGNKWDPGKNLPFDPTAAKQAQKNNLIVIIANGKNLANLKNILQGKKFIGTVIN